MPAVRLLVHPAMSGSQMEKLARMYGLEIEIERRGNRVFLRAVGAHPGGFRCPECAWQGDDPDFFSFEKLSLPSLADIPICPRCESFVYQHHRQKE